MKRFLLSVVAGALLAAIPAAVWAVTGAPDYSITPSGGAIACDIGPALTGAIPAAATQAGSTHCGANYDFTQAGSFTSGGHTYQWSNLSSWLECAGALTLLLLTMITESRLIAAMSRRLWTVPVIAKCCR
jgi:hypothetical protein